MLLGHYRQSVPRSFYLLLAFSYALAACGRIGYEELQPGDVGNSSGGATPAGWNERLQALGEGDGHWGALQTLTSPTFINRHALLASDVAQGSSELIFADETLQATPGDLLLVWQSSAADSTLLGRVDRVNLVEHDVGKWEFVRIAALDSNRATLMLPTLYAYPAALSQVVLVEVRVGHSLDASAWTGRKGGILALLVQDRLLVEGRLNAEGSGRRGGAYVINPVDGPNQTGCTALDEPSPLGALKGEGLVAQRFETMASGRGNASEGGGGGVCSQSGGGGGGHFGGGGKGGFSQSTDGTRDVGGMAGAEMRYPLPERLTMGGGGGAGQGDDPFGSGGGAGGGVIFVYAGRVEGGGSFDARGQAAADSSGSTTTDDGVGGGGGGGLVVVRGRRGLGCGALRISGGKGASCYLPRGPGGGGGGGYGLLEGAMLNCPVEAQGGAQGLSAGAPRGAADGRPGSAIGRILMP